ncbi:MAG: ABC transporter substrate-binding protein [Betaproteobacteria bacterium]|nr:ABC transporter substrate-binding protein [Betaproteobacteria bacterium]
MALLFAGTFACVETTAATLRWSSAGELVTCDPHSVTDTSGVVMTGHVYEKLVEFDRDYKLAPALATSWERVSPTVMRFQLRHGVTFHDGTPFTANDVVFSVNRIRHPNSLFKSVAVGFADPRRVDDYTVDIVTERPLPTLLNQLAILPIMSRAWAEKHKVTEPANYAAGKDHYATRNTNGTGPFRMVSYESGGKVVFAANPRWWGKRQGNVTDATYVPIKSNATRMAALMSGEVDLLTDPPIQDLERLKKVADVKLLQINEARVIFLGFDVARDELKHASVKGRNPFKDRRVREAVRLAIDTRLIEQKVMRGHARAIGSMISEGIVGYSARAAVPHLPDLARAKKLLAEAGYPDGFSVTLDCTNDRYILDEQLCTAVAGMITRIGIVTTANPKPKAIFFQRVDVANRDTSLFIFGAFPTTVDAHTILESYLHSIVKGRGDFNSAGYSNPKMDALVTASLSELDTATRNRIIEEALMLNKEEAAYIPLHQQRPSWAMRKTIDTPARLDNNLDLRFVTVK